MSKFLGRLGLLAILVGSSATFAAPPAELRSAVEQAAAETGFSGVVLIAQSGQPVLVEAYGLASEEHGVANRPDTAFNIGSINKVFTKLAIGQLVVAGKLSLDDSLGKWLPEYPNLAARTQVTVRHLVDMTAGIGDIFGERFVATPKERLRHNRDYLPLFADLPLEYQPGSEQRYSNSSYVLLGEIVARAADQDYYEYVQDHVFAPAGMRHTAFYDADAIVPNLAEGYTRVGEGEAGSEGPRRNNVYTRPARGSAAGGGYSTAQDLLAFVNALLLDQFLPPPWTEWVLGGPEPAPGDRSVIQHDRGATGFAGGAPGLDAVVDINLARATTVIALSNHDPPGAMQMVERLGPALNLAEQ